VFLYLLVGSSASDCFEEVERTASFDGTGNHVCYYSKVEGSIHSTNPHEIVEYFFENIYDALESCDHTQGCYTMTHCGGDSFVLKNFMYHPGEEDIVYDVIQNHTNPISRLTTGQYANCETYYATGCMDLVTDDDIPMNETITDGEDDEERRALRADKVQRDLARMKERKASAYQELKANHHESQRRRLEDVSPENKKEEAARMIKKFHDNVAEARTVLTTFHNIIPTLKIVTDILGFVGMITGIWDDTVDPVMEKLEVISTQIEALSLNMNAMWADIKTSFSIANCLNDYGTIEKKILDGHHALVLLNNADKFEKLALLPAFKDRCVLPEYNYAVMVQDLVNGLTIPYGWSCNLLDDLIYQPDILQGYGYQNHVMVAEYLLLVEELIIIGTQVEVACRIATDDRGERTPPQWAEFVNGKIKKYHEDYLNKVHEVFNLITKPDQMTKNIEKSAELYLDAFATQHWSPETTSHNLHAFLLKNYYDGARFSISSFNIKDTHGNTADYEERFGAWDNSRKFYDSLTPTRDVLFYHYSKTQNVLVYTCLRRSTIHSSFDTIKDGMVKFCNDNDRKQTTDSLSTFASYAIYNIVGAYYNDAYIYIFGLAHGFGVKSTTSGGMSHYMSDHWEWSCGKDAGEKNSLRIMAGHRSNSNNRRRLSSNHPLPSAQAQAFVCARKNEWCFCDGFIGYHGSTWETVVNATRCRHERCFCAGEGQPARTANSVPLINPYLDDNKELKENVCTAQILADDKVSEDSKPEDSNNTTWIVVGVACGVVLLGLCVWLMLSRKKESSISNYNQLLNA